MHMLTIGSGINNGVDRSGGGKCDSVSASARPEGVSAASPQEIRVAAPRGELALRIGADRS
ncbi:hypothetical protein [Brasilonema bromeliae]|uniref:hypothetical protein n=1 Tax=Brasilonema bromeliae TaxID=383615 RepID=UPI00145EA1E1